MILVQKDHCKLVEFETGGFKRYYSGEENKTESGKNCLNWKSIPAAKSYMFKDGVGNHNFCRKPERAKMDREFCFISETETEYCSVRTCGNKFHTFIAGFSFLTY